MSIKHGHCSGGLSKTYICWTLMLRRCTNPNDQDYPNYGGRGITIDPIWRVSFQKFLDDMGEVPKGLTLDRKDCNGNYCKDNCKWSTASEQALNRRMRSDNTSGRKGVYFWTAGKCWRASGTIKGKRTLLYSGSSFDSACDAREVWEKANGIPHYV